MNEYRSADQVALLEVHPAERPNFNDLLNNAEAGIVKRGVARYLFSRNPERTVKTHTYLGATLARKAIMGTYGKRFPRGELSNYRTDHTKSKIEASTRFAVGGSVVNELIHTAAALPQIYVLSNQLTEGKYTYINGIILGINAVLVSLQRYNRARMVQAINKELEQGNSFQPHYQNWLGIDARAVANYQENSLFMLPADNSV